MNLAWSGTATFGRDYSVTATGGTLNAKGTTLTLSAGVTSATIVVTPIDDTRAEPAETVVLTVRPGTGYGVGTSTATGTINDNDGAAAAAAPAATTTTTTTTTTTSSPAVSALGLAAVSDARARVAAGLAAAPDAGASDGAALAAANGGSVAEHVETTGTPLDRLTSLLGFAALLMLGLVVGRRPR